MARPGVTYSEVAEAATQLVGQGRNPTVEQIRFILGTGSSTTIANHLRQWKANQAPTTLISAKENLPPEFVAMMKGLWERVINHSEEQVASIEADYQQTISELEQTVEKYKTNNQRWQKMLEQWRLEKNQLATDKLTLEQALEFAHKENVSLHAKQDALLQQLQDREVRIDELHRLHKQAQENLEHYRESAREQRLLDQQQHEQQKQQLQHEMKNMNDQLVVLRDKVPVLQQQNLTYSQTYTALEIKHNQIQQLLEQTKTSLDDSKKMIEKHSIASLHWQSLCEAAHKKLDLKTNEFSEIRMENSVLHNHQTQMLVSLKEMQDQNKLLNHEKWELAQEKARLEGQLKQMQKMIVT